MNKNASSHHCDCAYLGIWQEGYGNPSISTTGDFDLTRKGQKLTNMDTLDSNHYIFGPFKYNCTTDAKYTCIVKDGKGENITGVVICNSEGDKQTLKGKGDKTFYLKISKDNCKEGISEVKLNAKSTLKTTTTTNYYVLPAYFCGHSKHQPVRFDSFIEVPSKKTEISTTEEISHSISWEIKSWLEIIKIDADDENVKLDGVEFNIKCGGDYNETKTTSNGKITLKNLSPGTYTIKETKNPNFGYTKLPEQTSQKITTGGKVITKKIENEKQTGNLMIKKVDADTDASLSDVTFVIKNSSGYIKINDTLEFDNKVNNQIEVKKIETVGNEDSATRFITDSNGCIKIYNLLIGDYNVIETDVGTTNKNNGYEVDDNYISWSSNKGNGTGRICQVKVTRCKSTEAKMDSTKIDTLTVKNKRKYINLSGYVWEDLIYAPEDDNYRVEQNGLWDESVDKRLNGITVQLIDTSTNPPTIVDEVKTSGEGEEKDRGKYRFTKVEIDKLKDYYIEFQYNAMSYENVVPKVETNIDNNSKASEAENRTEFNNGYQTITYGKSNQHDLAYETLSHESKLLYREDGKVSEYNLGYDGNTEPVSNVDSQYIIKANTRNAYGGNLNNIYTEDSIRKNNIPEIKNINLGIAKRSKIDLHVEKDIHSVKVSINDTEHVYKHDERFINEVEYIENNEKKKGKWYDISPKVKYESEDRYGNMSYTRAVYASDIYYNGGGDERKKLKVEITYHIGVVNNTGEKITTTVNEFMDYYDEKFEDIKVENIGKEVNKDGSVKRDENITITNLGTQGNYKKVKINTNLEVVGQEQSNLYIQLKVRPEQIVQLVNKEELIKLDNIVEINSYSTKKDGKAYAAIDTDSQPGNIDINDKQTYEDDNGKAPGFQIVLQDERKITGVVFKDDTGSEELQQGSIRKGDGRYNANQDTVIQGVEVKLVKADNTSEVAKKYDKIYESEDKLDPIKSTTNEKGEFILSGFIPDNYQVIYTWGGQTYTYKNKENNEESDTIRVQEFKSTIVDEESYKEKDSNLEWYKNNVDIYESDALDDFGQRKEIDKQSSIMTNRNKTVINDYEDDGQLKQEDEELETITKTIDASTPTFRVNVEYFDTNSNVKEEDEYDLDADGELQFVNGYVLKKEQYQHILKNIDFGIAKRAQQALQLDKEVKNAKITLANGVVLIDAKIENGKIVNDAKHAVYVPESSNEGQVKFEVDTELLQSAQLEIDYGLKITNISEIDYKNEDYYKYGIIPKKNNTEDREQLVQLDAKQVIDYLDNSISLGTDNQLGEVRQAETGNGSKQALIEDGLLADTKEMEELLKNTQKVLIIDKLSNPLKPRKANQKENEPDTSTEQELKAYRLLSNTALDEGISMNNMAEIIKIQKTWGAPVITIPGNYTPSASNHHEQDDSTSETVTVVPPTGLDTNYIAYTLLAISSLGLLVSGIVLIKKLVLK